MVCEARRIEELTMGRSEVLFAALKFELGEEAT